MTDTRPCTCAPDERPYPCQHQYALGLCRKAEIRSLRHERDSWQALSAAADADKRKAEAELAAAQKTLNDHLLSEAAETMRADKATSELAAARAGQGATLGESGMVIRLLQQERDTALADLASARARVAELEDALLRKGFVQCDIPACNCGSWHHRYGLPERWEEIKECLADAGHPLCNENGHVALHALQTLVSQRNALHERAERAETDLAAARARERMWFDRYYSLWVEADTRMPMTDTARIIYGNWAKEVNAEYDAALGGK